MKVNKIMLEANFKIMRLVNKIFMDQAVQVPFKLI